jgi:hypothetical protein|tara:strand:- start:275 stop:457 length:183 start_codon:yes stop_codon:yes gene_type:complete
MKVKLKSKSSMLPNCWKQCKASYEEWQELQSGKEIKISSIPESIKYLVEVVKSPSKEGAK